MIRNLPPEAVRDLLERDPSARLLDVRTEAEWALARLPAAVLAVGEIVNRIFESWDRDAPLVVYCHHGIRSRFAARRLLEAGFSDVVNLEGGIDAWSRRVDSSVPRYS